MSGWWKSEGQYSESSCRSTNGLKQGTSLSLRTDACHREREKRAFGGVAERKVGSCEVRRTFHDDRLRRREDSCRGNI